MNKEESKKQIKRLVEKYQNFTPSQKRECNESMICKDFVLPLFQALGWDVYNNFGHEVASEAQISGKRADYAFYVNDVIKFFVEAKKPSVDLREEKLAEQAVFYAWHKSVPWAILTNFEVIKVFNAEWDEPDVERSLIFEINYKDFLQDEKLWWLSKESMEKGELDQYAQENFKKPKREPVDKQLANDLVRWRTALFSDLSQWNRDKNLGEKNIAKAVQQLLDRFIFIRTTEDRKIEGERLRELVRNWEEEKKTINLGDELKKLFQHYNDGYDSRLFELSVCDKLEYEDSLFADVIKQLYKNKKGIRYDFASINADVLGSIYEQYLGQIQESEKNKSKRKSQGIYYTPRYIVDYIVKNTLGELLKGKSGFEASKIKILDPACGSGSFLIKAFEVIDNHIQRENNQINAQKFTNYARKVAILTANIYGVDLDEEAVEIAQLNLLLKVLEQREKLPNLGHNIENGNSLISGEPKELEKYFGKGWKAKKPFNWEEKFSGVFKQGGFDVIIGNPPYIDSEEMVKNDKNFRIYCTEFYEGAKGNWDIFCIFVEKALNLLRVGGYLGMIIPNKILSADYADSVRKMIEEYSVVSINDYSGIKVFGASVYPIVLIIQKLKPIQDHKIIVNSYTIDKEVIKIEDSKKISQTMLKEYKNSWSPIFNYSENENFIDRITKSSQRLKEICDIHGAATVNEAYELKKIVKNLKDEDKDEYFKFINTGTIDRYTSLWDHQKTQYIKASYLRPVVIKKKLRELLPNRYLDSTKSKLIVAGMTKKMECFFDERGEYLAGKSTTIIENNKLDLKFILALLNSKLLTFIFKNIFKSLSLQGGYLRIGAPQIKELPVIMANKNEMSVIIKLTDKIFILNKKFQTIDPILYKEEYEEKKKEIEKTDREIDQKVYELYGLMAEEIKIVEGKK
ncbi:MAG: hypothetical protein A2729_04545 [Candidatus Buchananbacteria bacterium RIFCSPHIGHO2_01_FULL_39_14]|uniref:site-specific DNA-methyltransferase (adenine-specific) n=2 Tax=Candidatus Buchananiibacteriota TaxID=1817903 RepID=A0A1G1YPW5_9BACT|nr:MAG: hypothetical protein A2729_04545 [Candidatus Buchananbacteria bacterium RIFCSPHIGHO2_01_FULL_39_14]OGY54319.1 MAG: hypothetical protein A2912_04770 [Candidatus Buchananbacteria bacterium RIFCSPLOWO2_01_FULL_40_23b]